MQPETPPDPTSPSGPLPYQSPGAHQQSQWITDDGPGGRWLVGCLIVVSVAGVLVAAVGGLIWFLVTGF